MSERLANNAQTTLAAAIDADDTSLTVASAAKFPNSGTFRIRIDDELLTVTAVTGSVFTVTRGSEGTTATNHTQTTTVQAVLTAAGLTTFAAEQAAAAVADVSAAVEALDEEVEEISEDVTTLAGSVDTLNTAVAGKQPSNVNLTALAALTGAADRLPYFSALGTMLLAVFTSFGRTLLALTDLDALKTLLGLGSAAYVASNTFAAASHNHDAAAVTSGVFDPARIPVLFTGVQVVSSGAIADLDAGQQATITAGAIVTTTDGRRWVYKGSGSKTSEASYIECADVTPDWSVIANKPSFATVATSGSYNDLSDKPTLGTAAALAADTDNTLAADSDSRLATQKAVKAYVAANGGGGGGGFETLVSGATVTLDFSANETAILDVDTDVTFAFSNLAAGKTKTVFVLTTEVGPTMNIAYPGAAKNVSNTALPTTISGSNVHKLTFHSTGTTAAEVMIEYANGVGTVFALTAPADISTHKGSPAGAALASSVSRGPNVGYVIVEITATIGSFTLGATGFGVFGTPTLDPDGSGNYVSVQFLTDKANAPTHFATTLTWYPPTSGGTPQVGTGAINCSASAGAIVTNWSFDVEAYGGDEVQQNTWSRFGSPAQCADGVYTLTHALYGTSGPINAIDGISGIQAALTALMGSAAPTVSGDYTTQTFTYSNGALAHTNTTELTVTAGTPPPHDGNASVYFSFTKTQTGDGVSVPDGYTGGWDAGSVGRVLFDGVPFIKGSGSSISIGGQTYSLTDGGSGFTLVCTSNFADNGTISALPYLGYQVDSAVSTTTEGNT